MLWSSHCSVPLRMPSPQTTVEMHGCPGGRAGQLKFGSRLQSALQPSPEQVLLIVALFAEIEVDVAVAAEGDLRASHARRRQV